MMETLNELAQLRDSGFGRPWPRHGLNLLYWFANDCVSFGNDNIMLSECDPADGDFGFHYFENRYDEYGDQLLPDIDFPYYVVGNLNSPGAEELPEYVSEDNSTDQHTSNTDRIIVSLYDEEWFHRVYVTQHHDRSNYDPDATYRISRGLLMIIRRMCLNTFLEEMDYNTYIQPFLPTPVFNYRPPTTNTVRPNVTAITPSSSDSDDSEHEIDEDKKTGYYTFIPTPAINYRPQTTSTASPPSSSDPAHKQPPAAQSHDTKIQINDNEKTGYYTYIPDLLVLPTHVGNYRPQTTNTVSPEFTVIPPSSSDPAHKEPPPAQSHDIKIQINDNEKTVSLPKPVVNYRPQATSTVSPEFTAATISSSDPAHKEPPATQSHDTKIQIDDDTSTQQHSANLPKKKGLCKRFCTIL
ncbi:uncharacterized protein LOC130079630 [Rhinichthys klamathensis goyatoka]|uniref:uncharacterized protein LOC130079630 n=1 Tax=Rhinichthys klamathensis goyatoka TaxID=3034132 RepID=UPI0024B485F8|nr:uncharacterized protein LOC130079630 [Rhinichthys klamathensis goyatoka]